MIKKNLHQSLQLCRVCVRHRQTTSLENQTLGIIMIQFTEAWLMSINGHQPPKTDCLTTSKPKAEKDSDTY